MVKKMYARMFDPTQPHSRGIPFGVVMATANENGEVHVGWSQCSKNDHFDRDFGTMIAEGRLQNNPIRGTDVMKGNVPESWTQEMLHVVENVVEDLSYNPSRYMS